MTKIDYYTAEDFVDQAVSKNTPLNFKCYSCQKFKPYFDFYKDHSTRRGYKNYCKVCLKEEREIRKKRNDLNPKGDYLVSCENKQFTYDGPKSESNDNKRKMDSTNFAAGDNVTPKAGRVEGSLSESPQLSLLSHQTIEQIPLLNFKEMWKSDKNYAAAFIAPRESGKTTMIKYLYPYWRSIFDKIIFFTKSRQAGIYDFLNKEDKHFVITHWDLKIIKSLEYLQVKTDNAFRFLIIFDDLLNKGGMRNSEAILDMFTRGRNMNCSIIISMQSCSYLHPDSRKNLDFVFFLGVRTKEDSDVIYERLMEGIAPIDMQLPLRKQKILFFDWMKEVTDDYWCMFISYRKDSEGNRIHKIKAPEA